MQLLRILLTLSFVRKSINQLLPQNNLIIRSKRTNNLFMDQECVVETDGCFFPFTSTCYKPDWFQHNGLPKGYGGKRNHTRTGRPCLYWDDATYKKYFAKWDSALHYYNYPKGHNYCRQPSGKPRDVFGLHWYVYANEYMVSPYCYTLNKEGTGVEQEACFYACANIDCQDTYRKKKCTSDLCFGSDRKRQREDGIYYGGTGSATQKSLWAKIYCAKTCNFCHLAVIDPASRVSSQNGTSRRSSNFPATGKTGSSPTNASTSESMLTLYIILGLVTMVFFVFIIFILFILIFRAKAENDKCTSVSAPIAKQNTLNEECGTVDENSYFSTPTATETDHGPVPTGARNKLKPGAKDKALVHRVSVSAREILE